MDELELLKGFRQEIPDPDEETVRQAWASMAREFDPSASRPVRVRHRTRRWALPAAVAAAVLAVGVALPVLLPGGHRGGAQSAAAAVLLRTSRVAAEQPSGPPPGPGQFVYTKTESVYQNDWADVGPNHDGYFSVLMPTVREAWIGTDGSGRLLETTGTPTFLSSQDRQVWEAAGRPDLGGNKTTDETYRPGGLSYLDLSGLPTDPSQLRTLIEERKVEGGPPGEGETFTIMGDLLRETYASPELRAALYQVAAELAGVELVGRVKDPVGRSGVAVAYTQAGLRHDLIFDSDTSALLGERTVVTDPSAQPSLHVEAGTVVSWAAYLASGVVGSTSEQP